MTEPNEPADASQPVPVAASGLLAILVCADGVFPQPDSSRVHELLRRGQFFWIDLVGGDEPRRAAWVAELGFDAGDGAWLQRFGQAGRVSLDRRRLRASTWLWEGPRQGLTEIHLLSSRNCALTAWDGNPSALDGVRQRAAETMSGPSSATTAAAILLQLVLSTLHEGMSAVDAQLVALQQQLAEGPGEVDFSAMNAQTRRLQSIWSEIERYSQAVKGALIGLGAAPEIDPRSAEELASYAEQVEDLESRFKERSEWGAVMLRDYATAIAHLQSQQISRLTIVSIIFLPITFLTGFFGMNFPWMVKAIGGAAPFFELGIALPAMIAALTVGWLSWRLASGRRRYGKSRLK